MSTHNPEDSAGAQLAILVAVKLLLSSHKGNSQAIAALESEMERMRADLLASRASDRKLEAFEVAAEALLEAVKA
jgi:hypothetical protein